MASVQETKINRAIHNCLAFCYQSEHILPRMAEFLSGLKASGAWRKAEIHEVELAVLQVLGGVVKSTREPENATNSPISTARPSDCELAKWNVV